MQIQTLPAAVQRPRGTPGATGLSPTGPSQPLQAIRAVASTNLGEQGQRGEAAAAPAAGPLASPFFEPGLQQDLAAAQQGLAWLDGLAQKLQGLKKSVSQQLAGAGSTAQSEQSLREFGTAWLQRRRQAGGMVDGQLRVVDAGQARQGFALRGLDLASLDEAGTETLSFAIPGVAAPIAVTLDPAEGRAALVQRLDQALAPGGLRATVAGETLRLSCKEAQWPALAEGLSIKGEGRRFPGGQRVRALLDAEPELLQPQGWSLDGAAAQRRTLGQIVAVQGRLGEAQAALQQRLGEQALPEPTDVAARGQALLAFSQGFDAAAAEPLYQRFAELAPALQGVRREHVQQLLLTAQR
ncbi:hypothetical protein [Roseateles violae]|uniref:Uncharacterized protein n=1 Tax=Roseateles violae TaxID=3058042 RepID=A0ABT8DTY6_9BURK|nr:hypothetical protein [Pelomonas sp. PFR6]MDN3921546.1 hypothetical protein [Pelomonas sp. PFR6]